METLEDSCECAQRCDVGGREHKVAAGFEDPVYLAHHVHGIGWKVLQKLTAQHCREMRVGIREGILLGVEQIDFATKALAGFGYDFAMMVVASWAVIAAADFAVAQLRLERGSDLEIGSHF